MYKTNKRKMNKKKDDYHNILCIIRAISEQFHISPELMNISEPKYIGYFKYLENEKIIIRTEKEDYLAEYYNTDPVKARRFGKGKTSAKAGLDFGIFEVGVSHEF